VPAPPMETVTWPEGMFLRMLQVDSAAEDNNMQNPCRPQSIHCDLTSRQVAETAKGVSALVGVSRTVM
jgi:hypothetical protein